MTGVKDLAERQVAVTELPGGVRVSTVFLDLCAAPSGEEREMQYETLILGGRHHDAGERYATIDEARAGHELWVLVATGTLTPEAIHEMREVTAS
jgi:hypothetical protein